MEARKGVWFALSAYVLWGLFPLFWNLIEGAGAIDLLANRIVWSLPFLVIVLVVRHRFGELRSEFGSGRTIAITALAAALLGINWGVWLYAVTSEQIIEASLGYFINPLVSVALGVVILSETLRKAQWVAVGLATAGVIGMAISVGSPPWIALTLAFAFGTYGLVKKHPRIAAPLISLTGEIIVLALPAMIMLVFFAKPDALRATQSLGVAAFLIGTGIVTTVPLLLFGAATKRVPLTTIGLLQYVTPTLQLLVGVLVFGEELAANRLVWFIVVWIALAIFAYDGLRSAAVNRRSAGIVL